MFWHGIRTYHEISPSLRNKHLYILSELDWTQSSGVGYASHARLSGQLDKEPRLVPPSPKAWHCRICNLPECCIISSLEKRPPPSPEARKTNRYTLNNCCLLKSGRKSINDETSLNKGNATQKGSGIRFLSFPKSHACWIISNTCQSIGSLLEKELLVAQDQFPFIPITHPVLSSPEKLQEYALQSLCPCGPLNRIILNPSFILSWCFLIVYSDFFEHFGCVWGFVEAVGALDGNQIKAGGGVQCNACQQRLWQVKAGTNRHLCHRHRLCLLFRCFLL